MDGKIKAALENVEISEDALSQSITELWRVVRPTQEEVMEAKAFLSRYYENYDPTDLEVAKSIIAVRDKERKAVPA